MCDEESNAIGDIVPDHCVSYRGCSRGTFLNKARDTVMEIAFQKEGKKHKDGLSLALTPADSIKGLSRNYGVIRISVGAIHQLNDGVAPAERIEVRYDLTDPMHILIRNLPCMDRTDQEKERAMVLSAELSSIAEIESATPLPTPPPTTTQGTA